MPKPSDPLKLGDFNGFIIGLTAVVIVLGIIVLTLPNPKWKCPDGFGIVSGMCVPGAVAPVRQ